MSLASYLLTVLLVGLVAVAYAWSADRSVSRLEPDLHGATRWLAGALVWIAIVIWAALLAGTVGLLSAWSMSITAVVLVAIVYILDRRAPVRSREIEVSAGSAGSTGRPVSPLLLTAALLSTGLAFGAFLAGVGDRIRTGMTGFDSTWYHGPIAAEIARTGDTLSPHFVAPQFLTWFYPHNSELLHSIGLLGFGSDFPSLMINLALFLGCLLAGWGVGRSTGAGPPAMAGVAIIIGAAVFADQAGCFLKGLVSGHVRECQAIEPPLAGLGPAVHPVAHYQRAVGGEVEVRHAHAPEIIFGAAHAVAGPFIGQLESAYAGKCIRALEISHQEGVFKPTAEAQARVVGQA